MDNIDRQLIIFPNPIQDYAYIKYSLLKHNKLKVSISDITGNECIELNGLTDDGKNSDVFLNSSELTNGIYFIRVETTDVQSTQKLIIINSHSVSLT